MAKKPNKLAELAKKINAEHRAVVTAFRQSVQHAHQAGTYLLQARELVIHGEWMPWVKKHCRFSYEAAIGYIRVASHPDEVKGYLQHDADLRLRELLKLLVKKPRPANKPDNDKDKVVKPDNDKDKVVKPDNDKDDVKPADVQTYNLDLTEADLNDDEAAELLTEKMHQYHINAELTDVLDFLTDVLGIGVDDVLRMLV